MIQLENIIVRPLITEKVAEMSESTNRYGFVVNIKANKNQIKQAIAELYNVRVLSVKTHIAPGKLKRAGRRLKKTSKIKKALVQLAEGDKIEFLKGV